MSPRTVVFISCVSRKLDTVSRAEDLYTSDLFEKSLGFARLIKGTPYILSAKHGLLHLDDRIETYNETLKSKSVPERQRWAKKVLAAIRPLVNAGDQAVFLAGEKYREFLVEPLKEWGVAVAMPLEGLSIGNQLKWMGNAISAQKDFFATQRLHDLLADLGRQGFYSPNLATFSPPKDFPKRGIYIFTDPKEASRVAFGRDRIVRIGTHAVSKASGSTLWQRMRTHRGTAAGSGNHRGSIFRLHVGRAIANRQGLVFKTWAVGQSASAEVIAGEIELEQLVSTEINRHAFYWIPIVDEPGANSDRSFVERNLIALLSRRFSPFEVPRPGWLGLDSSSDEIKKSGLWNINYTADFPDYRVLDYLHEGLEQGSFKAGGYAAPRAPANWRETAQSLTQKQQLNLPIHE